MGLHVTPLDARTKVVARARARRQAVEEGDPSEGITGSWGDCDCLSCGAWLTAGAARKSDGIRLEI